MQEKEATASKKRGVEDLDFYIGDECMKPNTKIGDPKVPRPGYSVKYPLRSSNFDIIYHIPHVFLSSIHPARAE